jgi:hypothetical protein
MTFRMQSIVTKHSTRRFVTLVNVIARYFGLSDADYTASIQNTVHIGYCICLFAICRRFLCKSEDNALDGRIISENRLGIGLKSGGVA